MNRIIEVYAFKTVPRVVMLSFYEGLYKVTFIRPDGYPDTRGWNHEFEVEANAKTYFDNEVRLDQVSF